MKKNIYINERPVEIEIVSNSESEISFIYNEKKYNFLKNRLERQVVSCAPFYVVNGNEIKIESKINSRSKKNILDHGQMIAPMPGKIIKILVAEGTEVVAGTPLLVMEAMKMEHTIKAAKNGIITKIYFQEGCQVGAGVELVTIC